MWALLVTKYLFAKQVTITENKCVVFNGTENSIAREVKDGNHHEERKSSVLAVTWTDMTNVW